ncbi:hypothetical protein [Pedobacter nutrimenti]|uniref:Uncharacterized protein n=1 Tax=Pedobacter nutrimenti TaxID=1241337 RepID=A0A318UDW2_9SPHI|nr:hypothetical protein [Pedobacter nutrimenti]PYF74401.1 hypothetical protein B0O44_104572 [Pedobacter nutrimenti]
MKYFVSLLFCLFLFHAAFAQKLNRVVLEKHFQREADTVGHKNKRELLYVLNGIPYDQGDSLKIDSVFSGIDVDKVLSVDFVKYDKVGLSHLTKDLLVITYVYPQKDVIKWKNLQQARRSARRENLLLYVDGKLVPEKERRKVLNALKFGEILYIESKKEIRVWKKDLLKS